MRRLLTVRRELTALARRALRGGWRYYTPYATTNTTREALAALRALVAGIPLSDGPAIAAYERRFAEMVGARHAFSFAAGRMAFYALLEALEVGPGDEVIVPGFTCVVVPNAILYRGATPVYVDIDARTFNLDPAKVEALVTPRTKAIVAQHTFGLACDVDAVNEVARRHGVVVIEDGAHALGARLRGRPVGSLGTAAFFSTDHTKLIGTCTGGMAVTSDDDLAARLAAIQRRAPFLPAASIRAMLWRFVAEVVLLHPAVAPVGGLLLAARERRPRRATVFFYDELRTTRPDGYPYPARLSNAQAHIGLSQLARLDAIVAARRALARAYDAELGAYKDVPEESHVFVRYVLVTDDREAFMRRFEDVMDTGVWFTSVAHGRDEDFEAIGYRLGSCPIAEHAAAHCANLPTDPRLGSAAPILVRLG